MRCPVNGADTTLIRHAIDNAAETALRGIRDGQPMHAAIDGMAAYVRTNLPSAIKRVGVSSETLETMCRAALARLMAERGG